MSKTSIRKIITLVSMSIIAILIGKQINRYFLGLDLYHLMYDCDTTIKLVASLLWMQSKINIIRTIFYIMYFAISIPLIIMAAIELIHKHFPEREIYYFCNFAIISTVIRNAIFITNGYWELLFIIVLFITILTALFLASEFKKEIDKNTTKIESDLFTSRKNTLDEIVFELESASKDSKGILIKGSWGVGKTTFKDHLKKKLTTDSSIKNKYKFIDLEVGYACEPAKLISEIESQLIDFLKEDFGFFDHRVVSNYFSKICELLSVPTSGITKSLYDLVNVEESKKAAKERLNLFLEEYKNTKIIIAIDDLERCPSENIKQIFAVLVNNLNLSNCITLLIADYEELTKKETGITEEYLKKFFTLNYTIHEVTFVELAEKYIIGETIIPDQIFDSNVNQAAHYRKILEHYWRALDNYYKDYINAEKEERSPIKTDIIHRMKKNIHNTRDFKCIWDDVHSYVLKVDDVYKNKNDYYLSFIAEHDIENTISIVVIMKKFFPVLWDEFIGSGSWDDFKDNYRTTIKYNEKLAIEIECFNKAILADFFVDVFLINGLVFGFKYNKTYDYGQCVEEIQNKTFKIDELNNYINAFYLNKKLIVSLGEYILENLSQIDFEIKLNYCKRFTESLNEGIDIEKEKIDFKIYEMLWSDMTSINNDNKYKYDAIHLEAVNKSFDDCQENVAFAVSQLLRNELKNIDYLADFGYSTIASPIFETDGFQVHANIFSDKIKTIKFERFMCSLLQYEETLDLRKLEIFIKMLGIYFCYQLQLPFISLNEDSKKKYNKIMNHIDRMYNVVTDWLGNETREDVIKDALVS